MKKEIEWVALKEKEVIFGLGGSDILELTLPNAVRVLHGLLHALGRNALKFTSLSKYGVGRITIGPSQEGVSIASMVCPLYNDPNVTLNFIGFNGEVIGVELCTSIEERKKVVDDARGYLE